MTQPGYHDAVNDALERMADLGYERGVGADLANHGPMGAEALAVLGYGADVAGWVERYRVAVPHHEPPEPRFPIDAADESDWRGALGRFERAGDWERLFQRELAGHDWTSVLARWWPRLLPGMFAGLTHGLIRTAHAARALHAADAPTALQLTELARGLAYWAARYRELPGRPGLHGTQSVAEAVAALPREPADGPLGPATGHRRLARLPEFPGYERALTALAPDRAHALLSRMTTQFADVYLGHPEVFPVPLVHGVTAPAAARLVLPLLPEETYERTLAVLWQVHTALLLVFTGDHGGEGGGAWRETYPDVPGFGELAARAAEHGDEHVIKFTEACRREHALRPDPRYPAAALAAQQRIAPQQSDAAGRYPGAG